MTDPAETVPWPKDFENVVAEQLTGFTVGSSLAGDTNLIDLGLDSLRMVRLLVAIEDTFDITLPDAVLSLETFQTPTSLWAAVSAAQAQR
ncbi:phosphopantetheine-binding protein [Dactylosporangium sp. NPDC051484]|uniref:phosphopantetheine-binding protein n=1 Tax=Dactylosporangium sp. NPDC051484 TaxID=3154942 RepID=UPI00344E83B9